jgi:predicted HicB family RNase H-like nuclease
MRYDPEDRRPFTLRLEQDLHEALIAEAQRQMRSLCCEIKFRLRQTLIEQRQPDHHTP